MRSEQARRLKRSGPTNRPRPRKRTQMRAGPSSSPRPGLPQAASGKPQIDIAIPSFGYNEHRAVPGARRDAQSTSPLVSASASSARLW